MNRIPKRMLGAALLAATTACLADGPIVLSKAEVEAFLPGKELGFRRRVDNSLTYWTFREDGWVFLRIPGLFGDSGHWNVDDDGRFCMVYQGIVPTACYHLARVDSGYAFTTGSLVVPFVSVR